MTDPTEPKRRKRERPINPDALAYGIPEAAQMLGIGRSSVYQLINAGHLKPVKLAGRTLITRAALQALLEREAVGG